MRKKRASGPAWDEPGLDISSLVDVSFLLLIFFLVTSSIVKKENELQMDLPCPNGLGAVTPPALHVNIAQDGRVSLGQRHEQEVISDSPDDHELATLSERIELIQSVTNDLTPLLLKISDQASHQRFTDVLNCFAKSGVTQFQILDGPSL